MKINRVRKGRRENFRNFFEKKRITSWVVEKSEEEKTSLEKIFREKEI